MRVSVGICAYNEERNITDCIRSVLEQDPTSFPLEEIVVVSSGSTDRTVPIVSKIANEEPLVKLVIQSRREGKNSAINEFVRSSKGDILVLVNADNRLAPGSLESLLLPFQDPKVGMVGGRPVPTNERDTIIGFAVHMLWDMHHRLSMMHPKIGELVAFRNIGTTLPLNMQSDEDIIRMKLEENGYLSIYAPEAIVFNRGPENISDFIKQRRRVNIGERIMKKSFRYSIPTWNPKYLLKAYLGFVKDNHRHPLKISLAVGMEAYSRTYASMHVALNKGDLPVWDQVDSTKKL